MDNLQTVLSTVFGLVITVFVPAVVWTTLIVGLYQFVRDSIRRVRVVPRHSQRLARESGSSQHA